MSDRTKELLVDGQPRNSYLPFEERIRDFLMHEDRHFPKAPAMKVHGGGFQYNSDYPERRVNTEDKRPGVFERRMGEGHNWMAVEPCLELGAYLKISTADYIELHPSKIRWRYVPPEEQRKGGDDG